MSILLGMGLAGLALVGCSKNNIAGPQALKATAVEGDRPSEEADNWKGRIYLDRRALVKRALPNDDSQGGGKEADRLETADDLGVIIDRVGVLEPDGRYDGELVGRPVAVDDGGSEAASKDRLVAAGDDRY
ncbi:MAG: hypothetical protein ACRECJ_10135 [Limisphaerales bacterium]